MSLNNKLRDNLNAITLTTIFEGSALNRDEKFGGNIPSIKKLTRFGNKTFSYLSRVAVRHYLFETLSRNYNDDWKPAQCIESGAGDNKVVQFDLTTQNILTNAELDAFGYMFTIGGQSSITRKAPIGITKAIALETWEGDTQFNANHDLAKRCGANPNPVNKEEQMSYFKVSFTIDIDKFGYDEWWIKDFNYDENAIELILSLSDSPPLNHTVNAERLDSGGYVVKKDGYPLGEIEIKEESQKRKAIFRLSAEEKKRRLCQILEVLKNGLCYHSSGENYGIVPQFIITAGLRLPIPIFDSFIELYNFENSILQNRYVINGSGSKKLVYIFDPKKLVGDIDATNLYTDWDEFLKSAGIK